MEQQDFVGMDSSFLTSMANGHRAQYRSPKKYANPGPADRSDLLIVRVCHLFSIAIIDTEAKFDFNIFIRPMIGRGSSSLRLRPDPPMEICWATYVRTTYRETACDPHSVW